MNRRTGIAEWMSSCVGHLEGAKTPSMVICRDQAERNIARWFRHFEHRGVKVVPHVKGHKAAPLAQLQRRMGSTCFEVSKPSELALWLSAVPDVDWCLSWAFDRDAVAPTVAELSARHQKSLTVDVDSAALADQFDRAAFAAGVTLNVRLQVDTGLRGARQDDAGRIGNHIHELDHLALTAVTTYRSLYGPGDLRSVEPFDILGWQEGAFLAPIAAALTRDVAIDVVCGSTFTADGASTHPSVTHVAAGAYALGDWGLAQIGLMPTHQLALGILTEVREVNADTLRLDCGRTAVHIDQDDLYPGLLDPLFGATPDGGIVVTEIQPSHATAVVRYGKTPTVGQRLLVLPGFVHGAVDAPGMHLVVNDAGEHIDSWSRIATKTTTDPLAVP